MENNIYIELQGSITLFNKATNQRKHLNEGNRVQVFSDLPELFDYLENQSKFRKWITGMDSENGAIVNLSE